MREKLLIVVVAIAFQFFNLLLFSAFNKIGFASNTLFLILIYMYSFSIFEFHSVVEFFFHSVLFFLFLSCICHSFFLSLLYAEATATGASAVLVFIRFSVCSLCCIALAVVLSCAFCCWLCCAVCIDTDINYTHTHTHTYKVER